MEPTDFEEKKDPIVIKDKSIGANSCWVNFRNPQIESPNYAPEVLYGN